MVKKFETSKKRKEIEVPAVGGGVGIAVGEGVGFEVGSEVGSIKQREKYQHTSEAAHANE